MRSKQGGYLEIEFGSDKVPEPKFPVNMRVMRNLLTSETGVLEVPAQFHDEKKKNALSFL